MNLTKAQPGTQRSAVHSGKLKLPWTYRGEVHFPTVLMFHLGHIVKTDVS